MKPILFDVRWFGDHGIGRFAREVHGRLGHVRDFRIALAPHHPLDCVATGAMMRRERDAIFVSPGYNSPLWTDSFAFTIHDLAHIEGPEKPNPLKAAYYELVMKPACRRALKVFTVSEYSRERIARWSGLDASRIINVGNGVDAVFSTQGPRHELGAPYVFCPGNRKPHKNEPRVLRAFASATRGSSTKLLFMGLPGAELLALADQLGVTSRIAFLGRVSDEHLACVYRGAQAVLFPSLYEGFGLPVIEGMACGTPVITSNVCSLPEVAGDAALLVDPRSDEALTEAIERVLRDEPLRAGLRTRGLANAARFSWDRTGALVRQHLDEVR